MDMVEQASAEYCEAVPDDNSDTPPSTSAISIDLDAIEADLAAVETALSRLDAGTYWTDEVTGEPLPAELLEANPLLRRLPH